MPAPSLQPKAKSPASKSGGEPPRDWKSYFKKTIVLVLVISFAVHLLFLLAFGSVAIFKGSIPKLPFVSQEIAAEAAPETVAPPAEEEPAPVDETMDPFAQEAPDSAPAEDSAPALDMLTVVGGATWAPPVPKNVPVSETGVIGGTGKGTGLGLGGGGGAGSGGGKQLFGIQIKARKLGVIVSINKGAQNSGRLPGIFEEIFKQFPDSPVFLTNGGGMMDWEKALKNFEENVAAELKKEKETGARYQGPKSMAKPKVARFNSGEALDWVTIRGRAGDSAYPGLRNKHPDLFEELRKRSNVWFITSYKDANGCYLAFEDLMKRGVEAIYWYNSFDSPIEGQEAEKIAQKIVDSKIEILVQNQGTKVEGRSWLEKVGAKFVK